jgi:hypothetical protein
MFSLTVIDHVRLDSEHAARNYTVHARAAERIVGLVLKGRIAITALLAIATSTTIANLLFPGRSYQIAAVTASALALCAFAVYEMLGLESRLFAHRSLAHRLWLVSERYRALLSEVNDGTIDGPMLVRRRDDLINELRTTYEFPLGADQAGHETDRLPPVPNQRVA